MTNEERLEYQRKYRKERGYDKRYERTFKGCLMRKYRNMLSRVKGIQKEKAHLYIEKDILGKEDFYTWATSTDSFSKLYNVWVEADYEMKLAPSVERMDSTKGYTIDNMEWITHSENSRRGSVSRWS